METVRSADGTTIAFDRAGDGPPLILIGGALSDRQGAIPLSALLSPRFSVIGYDRRGRGDSGDTPPYAIEREVEDIDALIDEAGGSAHAFGMSSGAVLALEAANRGSSITKLALYEPPMILDDSRSPVPSDYVEQVDKLVADGRRGDAVAHFLTVAVQVPGEMVAGMRGEAFWEGLERVAHTIAYDGTIMAEHMAGRPMAPGRWSGVRVPTLVMHGGESPPFFASAAAALEEQIASAQRRTIPGQAHNVDPEVLAPVLEEFFGG